MAVRWWTWAVWAALAASAVYWGLTLFVRAAPVPAHAGVAALAPPLQGDWTRVLGADPVVAVAAVAAPVADARFRLLGVVAPRSPRASGEGVALIAVDGKPPRAYRVGAVVDGDHVLQAVQSRGASLGPRGGAAVVALQIPPPQAASTGSLAGAGSAPPKVDAGPANLALPQSPMPLEPDTPAGSPQTR